MCLSLKYYCYYLYYSSAEINDACVALHMHHKDSGVWGVCVSFKVYLRGGRRP
ncbi:hypothetical protein ACE6H2_014810 [Prunus campanulata]